MRDGKTARPPTYTFTTDWCFPWQKHWGEVLAPLVGAPGARYLEIGVFEGRSLLWMAENVFTHESARVIGVDPCYAPYGERLQANLAASGLLEERIQLICGPAREELRRLPRGGFDVIYVDGSHLASDVLHDLVQAWELLEAGGVMIIDDYGWGTPEDPVTGRHTASELRPREAVDAFVHANRRDIDVLDKGWQVTLRKRPAFLERPEVAQHGTAWLCSPFGPHLYYWNTCEIAWLPAGNHTPLLPAEARIVEEYLRRDDPRPRASTELRGERK